MDINILNKANTLLRDEKSILRVALIVLTIISVLNYKSIENLNNNEKIIITPLNQSSQFWVSGDDASPEYLASLGLYAVQLWQNYTPGNAQQNFSRVLEFVDSDYYQVIKQQLKDRAALAKKYNRNSYSFEVIDTKINRKTRQIMITGLKTRWTKSGVKSPQKVELTINYQIENALFSITKLQEEIL